MTAGAPLRRQRSHRRRRPRRPGLSWLPAITLGDPLAAEYRTRLETATRVRIYQLLGGLFGNTNETRKVNAPSRRTALANSTISTIPALDAIRDLGLHPHLASRAFPAAGHFHRLLEHRPAADDPDLLKGLAGSPYAIKDYFDVCPDYARDPPGGSTEFQALLDRIHAHGLKAIIDLSPITSRAATTRPFARSFPSAKRTILQGSSIPITTSSTCFPSNPGGGPPLKLPTFRDGRPVSSHVQGPGRLRRPLRPREGTWARDRQQRRELVPRHQRLV